MKLKTKTIVSILLCLFFLFSPVAAQSSAENDENLVSLTEFARENDIYLYWDSLSQSGMLQKNGHTMSFRLDEQIAVLDYQTVSVVSRPVMKNGAVYIDETFEDSALGLFNKTPDAPTFRVGAIVIDAGHGGKDPGACASHVINGKNVNFQEKDINLNCAKLLYQVLLAKYPEKKILLTRSDDTFLSLDERVEIANNVPVEETEAVIFISIHINSNFNKNANGFEVFYLSPGYRRTVLSSDAADNKEVFSILNSMMEEEYTTESILMAKYVLDGIDSQIGSENTNRGVKEEEWFVVRKANMPSILIELGFITNEKEAKQMTDPDYLKKYIVGMYNGITSFVTHFEQSRGFTGIE